MIVADAPAVVTERHFFRCVECCNVFALEGPPAPRSHGWNGTRLPGALCPAWIRGVRCDCGGDRLEWMGRVESDKLVRAEDRCPCDSRCTGARGPKCNCVCGGKNHGTGRVVRVTQVEGVPQIVDGGLDERLAAVAAWKAARQAASDRVDADPTIAKMRAGTWIEDRKEWERANGLVSGLRASDRKKTLAGRMAALAKIGAA